MNRYQALVFLSIISLAIIVRFFQLGQIPSNLNRDEAALGYTAFSLILSGRDEHGQRWPVNIQSFGDWKLPGYVYSLIPFVSVFGLENWVVRLPSALAGVLNVVLAMVLIRLLLVSNQSSKKGDHDLLLIALTGLFMSFSPWAVHLSRVAYEANLAMLFLLSGATILLLVFRQQKPKKSFVWLGLMLGSIFFSLSLFTYHAYQVFTPIFTILLIWLNRHKILKYWRVDKKPIIVAGAILVISGLVLVTSGAKQANATKFSGLSVFSRQTYAQQLFDERGFFPPVLSLAGKFYANSISFPVMKLVDNLLAVFSTDFLFTKGGSNLSHNIPGYGNLYRFELPLIVIGFYFFWRQRRKWQIFIFGWLAIALVAPMITFDAAHTIRFSPALFPLVVVSAFGLYQLIKVLSKLSKTWSVAVAIIMILIAYSYFHFLSSYFFVFPKVSKDAWNWHMPKIVNEVEARKSHYQAVFMQGESQSPYIYFLFQTKFDPNKLETSLYFYPEDEEGFVHAQRLGKINFTTIDWSQNQEQYHKLLYILRPSEIPGDKLSNSSYTILKTISDPFSKIEYYVVDFSK